MFNIGDTVKTLIAEDVTGTQLFPVGFIGIITDVDYEDEDYTYEVKENVAGSESWWYPEEGLVLMEEQNPLVEEVRDNAFANGSRYAYKIITQLTENNGQLIKNIFPNLAYSGIEALDYLLSKFSFETLEEKIKEYKEKTTVRVGDIVTNRQFILKNEIYVTRIDENGFFQGFNIYDGPNVGETMEGLHIENGWEKIPDKHYDLKEVIKLIKGE